MLELLTILPHASEVDRVFYQDVWYDQEMAHGYILDRLKDEMGLAPTAEPYLGSRWGSRPRWGRWRISSRFMMSCGAFII